MQLPQIRGKKCSTYEFPNGKQLRIFLDGNQKVTAIENEEGSVSIPIERYDSLIKNAELGTLVKKDYEALEKYYEQKTEYGKT